MNPENLFMALRVVSQQINEMSFNGIDRFLGDMEDLTAMFPDEVEWDELDRIIAWWFLQYAYDRFGDYISRHRRKILRRIYL